MPKIVIVLHGSPKKEANNWDPFLKILAETLNLPEEDIKLAYLQFGEPSLENRIEELIQNGDKDIVVHPFFLSEGHHVTKDIPSIIDNFKRTYPDINIIYTKPLGLHEKLAEIVQERIEEHIKLSGKRIEEKSFEIIEKKIDLSPFSFEERMILKRVIHATADFEYVNKMVFHKEAIPRAISLLKEGKDILVDVEMIKSGINKRYGKNRVICYLSEVGEEELEGTRTEKAVEEALKREKNIGIIAIGNSPTALLKVIEILKKGIENNYVVIGMPVGFVKALEAKILLSTQSFPFITNLSRKGGSAATVAVVNALLKLAHGDK
ncbi:MAG: precorrin-8X methylmutase [Caldimicrobium sp.]